MKEYQKLLDLNSDPTYDMDKKFKNTWLLITKEDGTAFPAKYLQRNGKKFHFEDVNQVVITLDADTDCTITVPTIKQQLYQVGKLLVNTRFTAGRQYRLGINSDAMKVLEVYTGTEIKLSKFFAYWLYQEYPYNFSYGMDKVLNDYGGFAVSPTIGLIKLDNSVIVTYLDTLIGKVVGNTIEVHHPEFKQEIMDSQRSIDYAGYNIKYCA